MNRHFQDIVLKATNAKSLRKMQEIQSLWSGYGDISRYTLTGSKFDRVVIKHVRLPESALHPRGWNTNLSHQRKIRSYHVESAWYQKYSGLCDKQCRVPACYGLEETDNEFLIIMEDLNESGFNRIKETVTLPEVKTCIRWLAHLHATFMGTKPDSLWEVGTYWHLETRPDELSALDDLALKTAASHIDQILKNSPFQTLAHGDAKLANFCFSADGKDVAAVDFQYVGGGCGMKDLAYFVGSCLHDEDCERYETELLDFYFKELSMALAEKQNHLNPEEIEAAWRPLYRVAWTDFHRFLKGWSPGHWKIHAYSERVSQEVIQSIKNKAFQL